MFTVDHIAKPVPNAAQTLQDQQFENQESQEIFLQCPTPIWHRDIHVFARQLKEYSNEPHLSAVKAVIQYSETLLQSQDDEVPLTMKAKMRKISYHAFRTLQRPPSSQKIVVECFLTVQLSTGCLK